MRQIALPSYSLVRDDAVPAHPADAVDAAVTETADQVLIEHVLEGRQEAFTVLFQRYRNLVFHRANRVLGDADRAEDVVQEVFTAAFRHLDRLREPAAFGVWLSSITRNKCMNLIREQKLKTVSLDELTESGFELAAPAPGDPVAAEQLALIRDVIPRLPEKYREIVELRYKRELSYDKLAERLRISLSAVKSRLFHARQSIIDVLRKEGHL